MSKILAEKRELRKNSNNIILWLVAVLVTFFLSGCNQSSDEMIAFTHVNLIPMTSETIIDDQTVLVSGPEIVAIGDSDEVQVPMGAQVIDGDGAYLVPADGVDMDGNWLPARNAFLLPVKALAKIFRVKFRQALRKSACYDEIPAKIWRQPWKTETIDRYPATIVDCAHNP